ncbi:MAG: LL-diaminopimelate aminotransferase [Candidatus Margulisiibacteriota bacterium]|jgi:LL-diaminopimelate aminotransferase
MPKTSERLLKVPPYLFEEIDRKKREAQARGVDIINLGIGDPDQPTPAYIVEAMQKAVADSETHNYPSSSGEPEFQAAVARWYKQRFGVTLDAGKETTALIGSKEGLAHVCLAYIDKGDVSLVPSPSYPVYKMWTLMAGGEPYLLPLTAGNNFLPDLASIPDRVIKRAKLLFLNYPNNPTGAVCSPDFLKDAVAFALKNDLLIIYDNAYCDMVFDGYEAPSILQFPGAKDCALEFTSLSKGYNMTGWRIGMAAGNARAISALRVIKSNADSGQFKAIQQAAIAGLDNSSNIGSLNAMYTRRRDVLWNGLKSMGCNMPAPKATFYFWVPVPRGYDSTSFSALLLDECGIVSVPGTGYGEAGEGYVRLAITVDEKRLAEAVERMRAKKIQF